MDMQELFSQGGIESKPVKLDTTPFPPRVHTAREVGQGSARVYEYDTGTEFIYIVPLKFASLEEANKFIKNNF